MNKEALEQVYYLANELLEMGFEYPDTVTKAVKIIKKALTQEVSKDINVDEVEDAIEYISDVLEEAIDYEICDGIDTDFEWKKICKYINKIDFLEKLNKCNRYVIDVPKEVDDEDIQQMLSSLLVDALLGCDSQTDNEAKREIMKNRVVKNINTLTDLLITKNVPNQSAKEIKPPLMVLKTNVGNCVVCDNQVTSEENYCSECGVQLKELQND